MICESCGIRETTRVLTEVVGGEKVILYRCDECAAEDAAETSLERPCEMCRKEEGTVKLTRLRDGFRSVAYVCQSCAVSR